MLARRHLTSVLVGTALLFWALSAGVSAAEKEWTLLIHMAGDGHNEGLAIDDINALERGLDPTNYNVVVQLESAGESISASSGAATTGCSRTTT